MMRTAGLFFALVWAALAAGAADLRLYFIDVEGGQATLIVTPSGQTMLVDAGWPRQFNHGADRIEAAAKAAGVQRIDYMLVTHYHLDHVGGVPEVAAGLPVGTYIDHGPNFETDPMAKRLSAAYEPLLSKAKHLVVKPGDRIPLEGLDVEVVAAAGETIGKPLA